jgi:hypothetical protein
MPGCRAHSARVPGPVARAHRAVAEDHDVGGGEKAVEASAIGVGIEIEQGAALAVTGVQMLNGDLGHPGESTRSTSAPRRASVRVATGPAMTRVRSRTRTP